MKTVFINCSPKKSFSASAYLISLQRLFVKGDKVTVQLRNKSDYGKVLGELKGADNVVFCMPLYVDSVPSHVLPFLKDMESYCKENSLKLNVYSVSNNGFIEGKQSEPLMQVLRNFCERSDIRWRGGIGIGGGVMLNVTRILFVVQIALLVINILLSGFRSGNFLPADAIMNFLIQAGILLFLNAGVLFYQIKMGIAINKGADFGHRYTRILLPSFIFIVFADVFFAIISVFNGGIFRGWLARK